MKLLIYHWNSYFQYDIYEICRENHIHYQTFQWKFENKNRDDKFKEWFGSEIDVKEYDAVLSVNYYPLLSEVCQSVGVKYLAWCYDNPLNVERIEETLANEVNYVFLFDKMQYASYYNKGFDTVYYLPLGVNRDRFERIQVTEGDRQKYSAEVSFIGRLYESKCQDILAPLNDYSRGYLKSLMDMQSQIYGYYFLDEAISDAFLEDMNGQYRAKNPNTNLVVGRQALTFAMASEITRNNRIILLNLCGRRYDTKFYSCDNTELIQGVQRCGSLDYIKEMPRMFACSKVNLNPSLRIIQTGIPQRALDIMGAGGFLLSNYQEELMEYYENEKDMAVYDSYEDAMEKIDFYVHHEELRRRIAESGRRRTLEEHTMQQCMEQIWRQAEI